MRFGLGIPRSVPLLRLSDSKPSLFMLTYLRTGSSDIFSGVTPHSSQVLSEGSWPRQSLWTSQASSSSSLETSFEGPCLSVTGQNCWHLQNKGLTFGYSALDLSSPAFTCNFETQACPLAQHCPPSTPVYFTLSRYSTSTDFTLKELDNVLGKFTSGGKKKPKKKKKART